MSVPYITPDYDSPNNSFVIQMINIVDRRVKMNPLVLLTAPISFDGYISFTSKVSWKVAKFMLTSIRPILNFIGHESTAQVVSQLSGLEIHANRQRFNPVEDLDRRPFYALVFRLKQRLQSPQEVEDIKPKDLEVMVTYYYPW